ncbi:MAG: D-2-hydroxyacid dehydrogenase [Woeseia sp.]
MNKVFWIVIWLVTMAAQDHAAASAQADPAATELIRVLSLRESAGPIREDPRWAKPGKVVVGFRSGLGVAQEDFLARFQSVAPDAKVILFDPSESGLDAIADADVFIGFCGPQTIKRLEKLRWIHTYTVGVDRCLADPEVLGRDFIISNNQRVSGPSIAEHAIAMMMMLSKNLHYYQAQKYQRIWARAAEYTSDLTGRTMLVLGLGGIGTETARRASALGMRIIATRNSSRQGPEFVDRVGLPDEMYELAGEADFVVNALPLTGQTNGLIDKRFFDALKPGAYYISVGRGGTTVTGDLHSALVDGRLAGAALDVMDPEPLPADHPLWTTKNVVITPHTAGRNIDSLRRTLIIAAENLRRYVQGEKLLNLVDVNRGY